MRWLVVILLLSFAALLWPSPDELPPGKREPTQRTAPPASNAAAAPAAHAPAAGHATTPALVSETETASAAPVVGEPMATAGAAAPAHRVVVVDVVGAPIADALVVSSDGAEHDLSGVRTDARGIAALPVVDGEREVHARAVGFRPRVVALPLAEAEVRVVLDAAERLHGRVFDLAGGPIAGARVALLVAVAGRRMMPASLVDVPVARSREDGTFDLPFPDRGTFDLVVEAAGFATAVEAVASEAAGPVIVRLSPAALVDGQVLDALGDPVPAARIEVWSLPEGAVQGRRLLGPTRPLLGVPLGRGQANGAGRFRIADLPLGAAIVVVGIELGGVHELVELGSGRASHVELRIPASARITGTAPGGREVFVYGGPGFVRRVPIAADGRFTVAGLPPGRYLVGASDTTDAALLHAVAQEFELREDGTLAQRVDVTAGEHVELPLRLAGPAGGSVAGIARIGGLAARDCRVVIASTFGVGAEQRQGVVGADGAFRVDDVPPGDYEAQLVLPGTRAPVARAVCRVRRGDIVQVTLIVP